VVKHYAAVRRDEPMLLPPDVQKWLPVDHWVWLLLDVIERLDTRGCIGG
jgi:hypothetical protein